MKRKITKLFILLSLISFVGCGTNNPSSSDLPSSSVDVNSTDYEVVDKSVSNVTTKDGSKVQPFNTIVALRTFSQKDHHSIYPTFNSEMQRLHILFDRYNDFVDGEGKDIVNLKTINDSYGNGEKLVVDQDLIDLLNLSIKLSELTEGYFNPTMGELIDTWNYRVEDGEKYTRYSPYCFQDKDPREQDVLDSKNKIIPYSELSSYIVIDDEENTVEFKKYQNVDKVTLSLGAIAKGYAVEKVKAYVSTFDVPAMIDGGSSSSYALKNNPNPDRDYWLVGIASPYKVAGSVKAIATIKIEGTYTLSVSGDYESCFKNEEGIIRHHILNPYSGYPENNYRVVSLKSTSRSDVLDGLSTALFSISSLDKIQEIVGKVETEYGIEIAILLEKEIDQANKKIDIYVDSIYDSMINELSPTHCNDKINIEG